MPDDDAPKRPDLDCWSPATPLALALAAERPELTSALTAAIARPPAILIIDGGRPQAAEPEPPIDVILPIALRPAGHCPHARCCQCGAARGTPEHTQECPDALAMRALAKRSAGYTPRKLLPKKARP